MTNQAIFEIIGYLASTIIAISLLMKSLIRLRVLNGIGALVFVIYGILIKAYPVAFLNAIIVLIDIVFLIKMLRREDYFSLMEIDPNSAYLNHFINFNLDDIRNFFPDFVYQPDQGHLAFFVLRNSIPAGLVILKKLNGKAEVILDYALRDYRDFKIGSFIFDDKSAVLINKGIQVLTAHSTIPGHVRYLRQMGFFQQNEDFFIKELSQNTIKDTSL
jgi:hypothetical protein